jgi:hypothetical protein
VSLPAIVGSEDLMSGLAVIDADSVEMRVSRLARMPADVDAAISRLRIQIDTARVALGADAEPLLRGALAEATPIVPCLPATPDASLVLCDLEAALQQHHPEEIRVASYAFWCRVAARLGENRGQAAVQALLAALESSDAR